MSLKTQNVLINCRIVRSFIKLVLLILFLPKKRENKKIDEKPL
jgi:hypothetical protein